MKNDTLFNTDIVFHVKPTERTMWVNCSSCGWTFIAEKIPTKKHALNSILTLEEIPKIEEYCRHCGRKFVRNKCFIVADDDASSELNATQFAFHIFREVE